MGRICTFCPQLWVFARFQDNSQHHTAHPVRGQESEGGMLSVHNCAIWMAKVRGSAVKGDSGTVERAQALKSDSHRFKSKVCHLIQNGPPLARLLTSLGLSPVISKMLPYWGIIIPWQDINKWSIPKSPNYWGNRSRLCKEHTGGKVGATCSRYHVIEIFWKQLQANRYSLPFNSSSLDSKI